MIILAKAGHILMNLISEYQTKKNTKFPDKPNEDNFLIDCTNGIFIIVDGVSRDKENGKYPNPSPACQVSELFINTSYGYLKDNIGKKYDYIQLIKEAFMIGNTAIYNYNLNCNKTFLPGTVGIIVIIVNSEMYYGYIGDCIGVLLSREKKEQFTDCQTKLIHKHIAEYSTSQIRNEICNNIEHPYSYGVLDGRNGALDFITTGNINLSEYTELLLFTDGLQGTIENLSSATILNMSTNEIMNDVTNNCNDDKTLIRIRGINSENNYQNT